MNSQPKKPKMQGKTASHRDAIVRSQLLELVRHEYLRTTPSKAKLLRSAFDRAVTIGKKGTLASTRSLEALLGSEQAVAKFTSTILPRLQEVNSGYTHMARTMPRRGDNAAQVVVLVRGAQIKEKKSRIQEALKRREESDNAQEVPARGVRARLQKAAKSVAPNSRGGKKIDSTADTRRVST